RLAWARSDALRSQTRYQAADNVATSAISQIENLSSRNPSGKTEFERNQTQSLTQELLRLYALRYRIAVLSGHPEVLDTLNNGYQKALEAAKSRFSENGAHLWDYFEAKQPQVAARIAWYDGDYDKALSKVGESI